MNKQFLKATIIVLIFIFLLPLAAGAQETNDMTKILTEMSVDIKYIKNNIVTLSEETRGMKENIGELGTRITVVEERQINIKDEVCDVNSKNNWFLSIIGSMMLLSLGVQMKRSHAHRREDCGEENKEINKEIK